ncbi:conserved hypothetical protein [Sphingobacterium sp. PM2-P1-29]|nr:conserved hypothetical protein [Sphingobacterium sp. PM2-P1-29]
MNIENIQLYQLDDEKEDRLWKTAIFVFDSSALLDFYYLPKKTRQKIYAETFTHLSNRLWVPAHVEFEFLKNRENIIPKPISERYAPLKTQISNIKPMFSKEVQKRIEDIARQTVKDDKHPHIEQTNINEILAYTKTFEQQLKKFEENILLQIKEAENEISSVKSDDDILEAIRLHFSVGIGYSFEKIIEITKEGKHRYEFKIPPGYGDLHKGEKKGTQIFGDLIIWKQILEYSSEKGLPIIFITNDIKKDEDWCYLDKKSGDDRILAPREELIKEIFNHSNCEFWMYNLPQFLFNAKKYLKSDIPDQAIQFISQYLNTKESTGSFLRFKCNNCSKVHSYHKSEFDLDFDCVESTERNMGTENHYEAIESFQCTCGNEITATFEVWEYPIGAHNNDSIELDGGELLESFYFTIDFFEDDYDDFVTCEECDGNNENTGNVVHNWAKMELDNEFIPDHINGKYSTVIAGSCDWCNTLHIKCPKCSFINSFPESISDTVKECEGGCGLNFILESEISSDNFSEHTLKLKDDRIVKCGSCGDDFLDDNYNSICQKCEDEYNEK